MFNNTNSSRPRTGVRLLNDRKIFMKLSISTLAAVVPILLLTGHAFAGGAGFEPKPFNAYQCVFGDRRITVNQYPGYFERASAWIWSDEKDLAYDYDGIE